MFSRLLPLAYITLIEEEKRDEKLFSLIYFVPDWLAAATLLEFLISYTQRHFTYQIVSSIYSSTQIARYIYFHLPPPVRTLDRL